MEQAQATEALIEGGFDAQEVAQMCKDSPDFLQATAMPEIFEHFWPPIFIAIWHWLIKYIEKKRDFSKLAIGLPRGFGKTTVIKLFILYCILFTNRKFILILSNTATHAENIIADIFDMLSERNILSIFGDWRLALETDTKGLKKFTFRGRNIIVAGLGAGGSVRGLNIKNTRPDVMIFEDVQSREQADSQVESEGIYKWMLGTAMKAKSPKGCLTVFIANMYPTPYSILKKLVGNSQWAKYITGAITEDGKSIWEELQPLDQLLAEFQENLEAGHPEIFYSEVLNDPNASVNNQIDISKIPPNPYDDNDIHQGNFIIIDPATDKANSDYVAIGYFEVYDGKSVMRDLVHERLSPGNTIRETLKFCLKYQCRTVIVEGVAYQSTLMYWARFICGQMGIEGITFHDIYPGGKSKNSRILTMFKSLTAGELFLHQAIRSQVTNQIVAFNPLKTDNVDGILDLLTYAPRVITEYAEYIQRLTIEAEQDWNSDEEEYTEVENSPI